MTDNSEEKMNDNKQYKHPSEYKSCDTCGHLSNKERYGCHWRSEITMFGDKSPCLNWERV